MRTYTVTDGTEKTVYGGFDRNITSSFIAVVQCEDTHELFGLDNLHEAVEELKEYLSKEPDWKKLVGIFQRV